MSLPPELAPAKRAAVEALLAEVPLTEHPAPGHAKTQRNKCCRCQKPGKLSAIVLDDGTDGFIHRGCRRRLNHATPNEAGRPRP